jgi:hypothetical protein
MEDRKESPPFLAMDFKNPRTLARDLHLDWLT